MIFKAFHGPYQNKNFKIEEMHESPLVMLIPLFILALGAVISGYLFKELFIGYDSSLNFGETLYFFLQPLSQNHPPSWFILLTPISSCFINSVFLFVIHKNKYFITNFVSTNKPLYLFLKNKWYFDELYELLFVRFFKFLGKFFGKKLMV